MKTKGGSWISVILVILIMFFIYYVTKMPYQAIVEHSKKKVDQQSMNEIRNIVMDADEEYDLPDSYIINIYFDASSNMIVKSSGIEDEKVKDYFKEAFKIIKRPWATGSEKSVFSRKDIRAVAYHIAGRNGKVKISSFYPAIPYLRIDTERDILIY